MKKNWADMCPVMLTVKVLKIGTPYIITVIVVQIE